MKRKGVECHDPNNTVAKSDCWTGLVSRAEAVTCFWLGERKNLEKIEY